MIAPIKTNKITYTLDHSVIDERFDIFVVETSTKFFKSGAFILDAPSTNRNVLAVRFENGRRFHVIMKNEVGNKKSLLEALSGTQEADTITLAQVQSKEIEDHIILQLLLNSLGSVEHPLLRYNNLTGHLYCFHPEWVRKSRKDAAIWQVPCVELRITPNYRLLFNIRTFTSEKLKNKITFRKRKFEDYPKYVFSTHNTLRRKHEEDKETSFIQRQIDGEKTGRIDFLSLQSLKSFEASKIGVISAVIERFNNQFEGYAEIGFEDISEYLSIDFDNKVKKENAVLVKTALESSDIRIVDGIGDDYSREMCKRLQNMLLEKYNVSAPIGKRITKNSLNLFLIHNADYYLDDNDPHDKQYPDAAVQHLTFEDFAWNGYHALSTVVHEVLIKDDLKAGKIRLFDWETLGFTEDIAFGLAAQIEDRERYFFMNVHPDGSFEIFEQGLSLFELNSYSDCVDIFTQAKQRSEIIKGIIRDGDGNINIIKDTEWVTIPELFKIHKELENGNTALRNKEKKAELLNSVIDIREFDQDGKKYYFVGAVSYGMNHTLHTAANIRSIEPYGDSPILFDCLLPLMNVTFVRNNQLTVIPFPFKYLREYINFFRVNENHS